MAQNNYRPFLEKTIYKSDGVIEAFHGTDRVVGWYRKFTFMLWMNEAYLED